MRFKFSLRYRVAFAFLILGWLISMAMGGVLYSLTINMEEKLIEETLSGELNNYIKRYSLNENTPPPSSLHLQGYVINGEMPDTLPPQLQNLPLGFTHITMQGIDYYVEVQQHHERRFFVLYADQLIQQREKQYRWFLVFGMVLMTLLSSILGLWLAGQVIAPVTDLAKRVSAMRPDFSPLPVAEIVTSRYDEVAQLALAIDHYHQRLHDFNERERAFTGDVSHELRTPLAVIEGAIEVMLAQQDLSESNQRIMARIARASKQVTHLTTALLSLAREEVDHNNQATCLVNKLIFNIIDDHQYLLKHKPVTVDFSPTNSELMIACDPILLYVVLANIIRNAFSYTQQGIVFIDVGNKCVLVKDTGVGIKKNQLAKIFDRHYSTNRSNNGHGIGLSLTLRICQRYDWQIVVDSPEKQGTSISLLF